LELALHSPIRHPGVLEGDKDQVESLQTNAVELSIELIRQLLLQLTIILFRVYLGREAALRAKEARTPGRPRWTPGTCPLSSLPPLQQREGDSALRSEDTEARQGKGCFTLL
jgi:hypothetical protein